MRNEERKKLESFMKRLCKTAFQRDKMIESIKFS